ncbi:hypothetical protein D3C71_1053750 [compost metagenome]
MSQILRITPSIMDQIQELTLKLEPYRLKDGLRQAILQETMFTLNHTMHLC